MIASETTSTRRVGLILQSPKRESLEKARQVLLADHPENELTAELPIIDGLAVSLDVDSLGLLPVLGRQCPDVKVTPDRDVQYPAPPPDDGQPHAQMATARGTLHLDQVWKQGYKGQGIGIAIIDTGIAPHPDMRSRIVAFQDFVNGQKSAYDDEGHGTHVSSIAAGNGSESGGRYAGIAPQANLIGVKVLDKGGHGSNSRIVQGIQWAVDHKEQYNIRVMNISIGGKAWTSWHDDPMAQAVEAAVASGIVVAIAAGNSGSKPETIETPGLSPSAITAANLDEHFTSDRSDDSIANSSSRGPTKPDQLAKPDVAAPGSWITACDTGTGYTTMSGTSMASPMVAGTAALLIQAQPDLTPSDVKAALMQTAAAVGDEPPSAQGRGMIDPPVALDAVLHPGKGDR